MNEDPSTWPAEFIEAKIAEANANAAKSLAEAAQAHAEARKVAASAEEAEIELDREKHDRRKELATDEFHKVYRFTSEVTESSVKACMKQLAEWSRLDPGCEMEICFSSPGGAIIHGVALYDFIRQLQTNGHYITTRALGYAASMAGILLQVGDHRIMAKESWLLIHQGSGGAVGSMGEVEDTVAWFQRIRERIVDIFYDRSHAEGVNAEKPLGRATIKKKYERKDWWLSSEEALKHGFCDEIA